MVMSPRSFSKVVIRYGNTGQLCISEEIVGKNLMSIVKWAKRGSKHLMIRIHKVLGRSCAWLDRVGCINFSNSNINGINITEFGVKKIFPVILIIEKFMFKILFVDFYFGL